MVRLALETEPVLVLARKADLGALDLYVDRESGYLLAGDEFDLAVDCEVPVGVIPHVTGIGYDRAEKLGSEAARFHRIPRVVSNLGTFDFDTSSHTMRLRSVHPGVTVDDIVAATGFELVVPDDVPESRVPTAEEVALLRDVLDPNDLRTKEVPG